MTALSDSVIFIITSVKENQKFRIKMTDRMAALSDRVLVIVTSVRKIRSSESK